MATRSKLELLIAAMRIQFREIKARVRFATHWPCEFARFSTDPVFLHEPPDPLDDVTVREAHETAKPPLARSGVATVNLFPKYLFCLKKLLYIFA